MPRIKSYTPSWLNEPAPGHGLFAQSTAESKLPASSLLPSKRTAKAGPRKTIARRGTEVFVAVRKEIRWGDLVYLKDSWTAKQAKAAPGNRIKREDSGTSIEVYDDELDGQRQDSGFAQGIRTIKTPVADDIRQLIISPQGDYLAILTTHTVHICLLPDSAHLTARDTGPLKPKLWTLGPTTHVTSRAAVVSALWHPLGVKGSTLVTVTEDAVVRVWDLAPDNKWSFDSCSLAIDLKKLADGTSLDQDFSASTVTTKMGFSPDSFDMEVAAACFAGRDSGGWSPMTLWVAMRGGDVYALCPLLPQRWAPPPTLIPALSVSIVSKVAALEDDLDVSSHAKLLAQQQLDWMSEIDAQEPKTIEGALGEAPMQVYSRPSRPGVVPKLQGPFALDLGLDDEDDLDLELTDIYAIGERINTDELMSGEDEELDVDGLDADGLSLSVICLLSTSGQLKICLDLDGVEAQWLPPRNKTKTSRLTGDADPPSLLTFQTFDILRPAEVTPDGWPMFSDDVTSRYSFFVTHCSGITYVSLSPWVFRLESEIQAGSEAGSEFRLELLVKGSGSMRERVYTQNSQLGPLAACAAIRDPDLGYFALSATQQAPVAMTFETPDDDFVPLRPESPSREAEEASQPPVMWQPRPPFQPSEILEHGSKLPGMLDMLKTGKHKALLHQDVRLDPTVLSVFTGAHRVISPEVQQLNAAVAELFRKCEALKAELKEQIAKANEVRGRVDDITGDDMEDGEPVSDNEHVRNRLRAIRLRQGELAKRMEALKGKLGKGAGRELSDKEKAWMEEVRAFDASITSPGAEEGSPSGKAKLPWKRFEDIKSLKDELSGQAERIQNATDGKGGDRPTSPGPGMKIPLEIRKAKLAQVMSLLDRETALVDAVKGRLERLILG